MKTKPYFSKSTFRLITCATILIGSMNVMTGYGQFWPVNFDGAPALKPGQIETTLFFSGSYASSGGYSGTVGYLPGIKLGFGIAKNFDLKLSYSRSFYTIFNNKEWMDSKENNITVIPKVSFAKGILGFKVPVSFILYNDYPGKNLKVYYIISPRLIISLHYKQYIECNISPFYELYMPGSGIKNTSLLGGNLGFAFSSNLNRWSVRPEAFLSYPIPGKGEISTLIYGWGIAATINLDVFTKK